MSEPILLDDEALMSFVVNGYLVVNSGLPAQFHEQVVAELDDANRGQPNPRSGIVEAVPRLRDVYDSPTVRGALISILGPEVELHPYTLSHCNPPGYPGQMWHCGSAYDYPRELWRVQMFYFPRQVYGEMGASVLAPGTQYRRLANTDLHRYGRIANETFILADPGDVLIMHYDIWHRGSKNISDEMRYMVKTVGQRMKPPTAPSWRWSGKDPEENYTRFRQASVAIDNEIDMYRHQERYLEIWAWLHGRSYAPRDWFPEFLP